MSDKEKKDTCAAYGCPLLGTIGYTHGGRVCACHFQEPVNTWQEITRRLQAMRPIVQVLLHAMRADSFDFSKGRYVAAQQHMVRIGRPDLAPCIRKELVKRYSVKKRGEEHIEIVRDETKHIQLWIQRLFATIRRECTSSALEIPHAVASNAAPESFGCSN